ncbi:11931_t:CDS:2 [Ambispora gerdemannii]|uniref:11931_t:CDS:1 n=1 Tax=Ambispora gerdemannii TaxID=144530 RepID=A0A9N9CJ94_9GLOM|nr:11931_t:CDS:2 [Ambispora gerdemannii]
MSQTIKIRPAGNPIHDTNEEYLSKNSGNDILFTLPNGLTNALQTWTLVPHQHPLFVGGYWILLNGQKNVALGYNCKKNKVTVSQLIRGSPWFVWRIESRRSYDNSFETEYKISPFLNPSLGLTHKGASQPVCVEPVYEGMEGSFGQKWLLVLPREMKPQQLIDKITPPDLNLSCSSAFNDQATSSSSNQATSSLSNQASSSNNQASSSNHRATSSSRNQAISSLSNQASNSNNQASSSSNQALSIPAKRNNPFTNKVNKESWI